MKNLLIQVQQDTVTAVDTLTRSYSEKWEGVKELEKASPVIETVASHDLIFVVLTVSLIIWFVLLFYIIRVDKKVSKLEEQVELKKKNHET